MTNRMDCTSVVMRKWTKPRQSAATDEKPTTPQSQKIHLLCLLLPYSVHKRAAERTESSADARAK